MVESNVTLQHFQHVDVTITHINATQEGRHTQLYLKVISTTFMKRKSIFLLLTV